jgi:hypothetical protein
MARLGHGYTQGGEREVQQGAPHVPPKKAVKNFAI